MFFGAKNNGEAPFGLFWSVFSKSEPLDRKTYPTCFFCRRNLGGGRAVSIDCRDIMMFDISRGADDRP
jgi:hypothetical protein